MVDERVRDGQRIAQLLASELTGRATGPLADVSVVDADPSASPSPGGTRAYDVAFDGERVATVRMTERTARVELAESLEPAEAASVEAGDDLSVESGEAGPVLVVGSGAAVKGAVDVLVELLA
jgi:hypothetical protein